MSQFFENGKWLPDIDRRRAQSGTSALVADFQGIFRHGRACPAHPRGSARTRLNGAPTACDAVARLVDVNGRIVRSVRTLFRLRG